MEEIESGDVRPAAAARPRRVPAGSAGQGELDDLERDALNRLLHQK